MHFLPSSDFLQLKNFSLHQIINEFIAFIKATVHVFIISIACTPFSVDWLAHL